MIHCDHFPNIYVYPLFASSILFVMQATKDCALLPAQSIVSMCLATDLRLFIYSLITTEVLPGWKLLVCMIMSSNGNIVRVTGPLCGESTSHQWIPLTQASDAELWCFLWSRPEQKVDNRNAGDLRCHHADYDVTVMRMTKIHIISDGSLHEFSNLASDWLAAQPPANQNPGLKILYSFYSPGF